MGRHVGYDGYRPQKGNGGIKMCRGMLGDVRTTQENSSGKHGLRAGETEDETVITIETSPALMPPAWVNFLKQRLHLLHLDCKQVGAGRIVVMSTPHAAESVARLVLSAIQCADHYFQTAVRNR